MPPAAIRSHSARRTFCVIVSGSPCATAASSASITLPQKEGSRLAMAGSTLARIRRRGKGPRPDPNPSFAPVEASGYGYRALSALGGFMVPSSARSLIARVALSTVLTAGFVIAAYLARHHEIQVYGD